MSETTTTEATEVDGRTITVTTTTRVTTVEYPATVQGERARLLDALTLAGQRYSYSHPLEYAETMRIIRQVFAAPAGEGDSE